MCLISPPQSLVKFNPQESFMFLNLMKETQVTACDIALHQAEWTRTYHLQELDGFTGNTMDATGKPLESDAELITAMDQLIGHARAIRDQSEIIAIIKKEIQETLEES